MLEPRKKKRRPNKWTIVIPIVLVMISSILILNGKVLSEQTDPKRYISFDDLGLQWEMESQPSKEIWTNKENISFVVNLGDDYGRVKDKTNINPDVDKPISVSATQGETVINNVTVTPEGTGEAFKGLYTVSVPVAADGEIKVDVEVVALEKWNNPASEGSFTVNRDTTNPTAELNSSNGLVNDDFYTEDVMLTAVVNEANVVQDSIKIHKKKNDEAAEIFTAEVTEDGKYTKDLLFKENGNYEVIIEATDKAGNNVSETFYLTVSKPGNEPVVSVFNMNDGGKAIKDFAITQQIGIKVDSEILIGEASLDIIKDGEELPEQQMVPAKRTTETFEYDLTKGGTAKPDGVYQVKVTVKDHHNKGILHDPVTYSFVVDNTRPKYTYSIEKDKNYSLQKNESMEVEIELHETNIQSSNVTVKMQNSNGEEKSISTRFENGKTTFTASEEGEYSIQATAIDKAGNEVNETTKFKIDKESGPFISMKAGSLENEQLEGQYFNKDTQIDFFVTDLTLTEKSLNIKKDGAEVTHNPFTQLLFTAHTEHIFKEDGKYSVEVTANDFFNNQSSKGPFNFIMDQKPPVLEILDLNEGEEYGGVQNFTIKVTDENFDLVNTKISVWRDGEELKDKPVIEEIKDVGLKGALYKYSYDVDGNYEIRFDIQDKATNKPVNASPIFFTIDQNNPELTITNLQQNGHYPGLKDATFTIEDLTLDLSKSVLKVTKEDGTFVEYDKWTKGNKGRLKTAYQVLDFEEEGDYKLEFEGYDKKGNSYAIKPIQFTIDKTNPELTFTGINEKDFVKGGNSINVEIDEHNHEFMNVDVYYKVNGGEKQELAWTDKDEKTTNDYTFKGEGNYEFTVIAMDKAGNQSTLKRTFTVDDTPPTIKITGADDNSFSNKDREIIIQVNERNFDNNNVEIEFKFDGEKVKYPVQWKNDDQETTLKHRFEADGDYEITVKSEDAAGNSADTKSLNFTIDKTEPKVELATEIENGFNYSKNMLVKMKVEDRNINLSDTVLSVEKNGKPYNVGQLKLLADSKTVAVNSYTFFEEGNYVINLKSTDKAGNTQKEEELSFIIDKTNPVVKIDGVENNSFNPENKNVTISIDELNYETNDVSISATKDGSAFSIGSWKNTGKLSKLGYNFNRDGLYTIQANAKDKAGNGPIAEKRTFTIDKTKPEIEITGVENNAYYNVDKPVNVSIKDVNLDINKITVTRNGARYNAGGFSVNGNLASLRHNFSAEGEYNILVEATDKAGNSFSKTMKFTIDKTKPVITPKFKGQNRVIKDGEYINEVFTPEFALAEAEDMIVSATLNNGANLGKNVPVAAREMKYIYKVLARDKAGNESTLEISFTLDTTKPMLNITGVLDGFFNKDIAPKVTYSDIHLDRSKTSVTLNGKTFENGTKLEYEQDYILKAVITDLANNVSSRTIVFTIDKTKPVIKFKEPISNNYFNTDLLPQLLIEDMNSYDIIAMMLDGKPYEAGDPIKEEGKHVMFFEVKDKAGNIQQLSVEFIIDKTAPKVVYEGVKNKEKYYDPVDISIRLNNPNDKIKSVMINGEMFDGDVVEEDGFQVIKTKLAEIKPYEIKVTAYDEAGNEKTTVISFEIVEKGALVKFYENKPLLGGTIAGLVGLLGAAATVLVRRRKVKVEEE
ncbi:Ig-like domain-containing protein [Mesobacillus jeotgali]|uniref:Ig-like domain-containing protein n=1 Tax=Mesobacillus jeotgali TaxID=129985 RepID=A0ABY9VIR1_9BACI|nr:Ig-like domain-containing protein [Mesobacillus jeotgali]WNF22762.1 Ig-like domain-containing protein [Mesobacillus jeotgali]